jgi:hypothetical protein
MGTGSQDDIQTGTKILLYPNPAATIANLRVEGIDMKAIIVEITDMQGRLMDRLNGEAATSINVSRYDKGVYLVRIFENNRLLVQTEKLIVK